MSGGILGARRKKGRDENLERLFRLFFGNLLDRGEFQTGNGLSQRAHHFFDSGRSRFDGARHGASKLH
jgi:hypothetical protein